MKHLVLATAFATFSTAALAGGMQDPVVVPAPVVAADAASSSMPGISVVMLGALLVVGAALSGK